MTEPILLVLSGPNLNLLGEREPDVYGDATLADHVEVARQAASEHGMAVEHLQSNHEGVGSGPLGEDGRQAIPRDDPAVLGHSVVADSAKGPGQLGGVDQTDGHRFAMAEAVAANRLQGVPEGVAVIENGPPSGLVFVLSHHRGLDLHTAGDSRVEVQTVEVRAVQEVVLGHLA